MLRLPAFPRSRILHPKTRAPQSSRGRAPRADACIRTGLKTRSWSSTAVRQPSWGNFQRRVSNGTRWTTGRPLASLQEAEKPRREVELGEAMEMDKEVGLAEKKDEKDSPDAPAKPNMCTADELHYVPVPGTAWRLALWRYLPSKNVRTLNFQERINLNFVCLNLVNLHLFLLVLCS